MKHSIVDPVFEELQNLMRRRAELDAAIAALERIRLPGLHFRRRLNVGSASDPLGEALGWNLDLSSSMLSSAIVAVIEAAGRALTNAEIVDALIRGGLRFRGTNPPLAVAQALSRMVHGPGSICKLGRGRWASASALPDAVTVAETIGVPIEASLAMA